MKLSRSELDALRKRQKDLTVQTNQFLQNSLTPGTAALVNALDRELAFTVEIVERLYLDKSQQEELLNCLDRIQIGAEQAALERDNDKRHTFLQKITRAKSEALKIVLGE